MSDQINKDGGINHRPDLDPLPRTSAEWNDETVLLRRQLTASQARVKELEQELQHISTNLCGIKVEGEVTFDMVYCFVEGQIDKQSDRATKAEQTNDRLVELVEKLLTYERHAPMCARMDGPNDLSMLKVCDCGLGELCKKLERQLQIAKLKGE